MGYLFPHYIYIVQNKKWGRKAYATIYERPHGVNVESKTSPLLNNYLDSGKCTYFFLKNKIFQLLKTPYHSIIQHFIILNMFLICNYSK